MKNINYDLVKLLHTTADTVWRLENYYVKDAEAAKCHSIPALKEMLEAERKHMEMLREEIAMRAKYDVFN